MKFNIKYLGLITTFFCLGQGVLLMGQEILTLNEAIAITLVNNYDIQISEISEEQAEQKLTKGYAGYYPQISLNGGYNWSSSKSESTLELAGFEQVISGDGAVSNRYNGGLNVQYALYNGGFRKAYAKQLQELHQLSEIQSKMVIDNLIFQLLQAYYTVAQLQEQINIQKEIIDVSENRLQRAQVRFDLAAVNRLEVLNAQVAFDTDSLVIFNRTFDLDNAKRNLNYILNRDLNEDFSVTSNSDVSFLIKEDILAQALQNSPSILLNQQQQMLSQTAVEMNESSLLPAVNLSLDYAYNGQNNEANQLVKSSAFGPSAGISLIYQLFDGGKRKIDIAHSQLELERNKLQRDELELEITNAVNNAFSNYVSNLEAVRIQEKNEATAKTNLEYSLDLFDQGGISSTQFREAQLNLQQIQNAIIIAKMNVKLAELELLRLAGSLVE